MKLFLAALLALSATVALAQSAPGKLTAPDSGVDVTAPDSGVTVTTPDSPTVAKKVEPKK